MLIIGEFAFYIFMEVLMYGLGRAVIFLFSFGRARAENSREMSSFRLGYAGADGKVVVSEMFTILIGFITLSCVLALILTLRG